MQTDTADASNSKQKRQHWANKNQIKKPLGDSPSSDPYFYQ